MAFVKKWFENLFYNKKANIFYLVLQMIGILINYKFLMSSETQGKNKEWVDQCTSIKPTDDNYHQSRKVVSQLGCTEQN